MASSFTPQQIEDFLQEFFDVVGARQYVGARYIPIFGRAGEETIEWDNLAPYEPLTVVMHEGISYVSRRYVPDGISIYDTAYWAQTYRFNAQVEQYRQQVLAMQGEIDERIPYPDATIYPKYGTIGQVLSTLADGAVKWQDPVIPSQEQAEAIITEWLDQHPEATTTVEDNSITTAKLRNGAVTDEKLAQSGGVLERVDYLNDSFDALSDDILDSTANLFDDSMIATGGYYNANGVFVTDSTSTYSEQFVKVEPGQAYSFSSVNYLSALNINTYTGRKVNIERISPSSNTNVTFGNDVRYIRFSYYRHTIPSTFMVVQGTTLPSGFIPYLRYIKTDDTFTDEYLPANSAAVGKFANAIAHQTDNLFDASQIIDGYHYMANGTVTPQNGSQYSPQYIKVDPTKVYSFPATSLSRAQFVTYDTNKNVLARVTPDDNLGYSFGAGVSFVRLSYYLQGFPDDYMFVEGDTLPGSYVPYGWEIDGDTGIRRCRLQYSPYVVGQYTEKVDIYIPDGSGYVHFVLYHCVDNTVNANNWRLGDIYATDSNFEAIRRFTSPGEIEMAIKIRGRSDYMGGIAHGDEIMDGVQFLVDGRLVDITTLTEPVEFDVLRVFEATKLYDPNDGTTHVADHGREYAFTAAGLDIRQAVEWVTTQNIVEAYMGMLIGAQTYDGVTMTDHILTDDSFKNEAIDTSTSRTFYDGARYGALYGATSGIFESMELLEYPTGLAGGDRLEMRVTAGSNNKLYAIVVYDTTTGQDVAIGDIWRSHVRYAFEH